MTTFAVYGGFNHIFLFRFLVVVVFCLMFSWYRISSLHRAFVSTSLYGLIELLDISSFADNCDNLNYIDFGSCLVVDGK